MNTPAFSGGGANRRRFSSRRSSPRFIRLVLWLNASVGAFLALVAAIVLLLVYSPCFHGYLIGLTQRQVKERLGLNLHLQNFAVHLSQLSVDLWGITVDGTEAHPSPPFLQAQHVEVSARIISVLGQKWYLQSLEIDRPVVEIFVDKNGVSNIPSIKSRSSSGNSNTVFDMGIRHIVLKDGAVFYNDKPAPVAADLDDLELRSAFDNTRKLYLGELSYGGGNLQYGDFNPARHGLDASFRATPSEFDLQPVKLAVAGSVLTVWASVKDYNSPRINARYDATIEGERLRSLMRNAYIPTGLFRTAGSLQLYKTENESWMQALKLSGWLGSHELDLQTPELRAKIQNVAARYSFANSKATVDGFRADALGGTLAAGLEMTDVAGSQPHTKIHADLRGISLGDLVQAFPGAASAEYPTASGRLEATTQVAWGKTLADLMAHADATVNGQVESRPVVAANGTQAPAPRVLPLYSEIHATYNRAKQEIALVNSSVRAGQTDLTMNGMASRKSSLAVHAQLNDLREVAMLVNLFQTPTPGGAPPRALDLAGRATLDGNVSGAVHSPRLTGQLAAQDLQWNGTTWPALRTGLDVSPSHVGLTQARIETGDPGQITLNGALGLTRWHFEKTNPVQLDMGIAQISLGTLMRVAGQQIPADGMINGNVRLHGSVDSPQGNGTLLLTKATIDQEPVQMVRLNFTGGRNEVRTNFSAHLPAGGVHGEATIRPREKTYTAQLTSDGIRLQDLELVQAKKLPIAGTIELRANGSGSLDNPQVTALVQVASLVVQKQTLTGLNLRMNLANHVANATLHSTAVNTSIEARAKIELAGDYLADAAVDTNAIPLAPLLAIYAPEEGSSVKGQTELHATLHGPLRKRDQLEAHVIIPQLKVDYNNNQLQLAAAQPIHADFHNGFLTVQPVMIRGTDTELRFQGSIPTTGNGAMRLQLLGTLDLALIQVFDSELKSSGQLRFNIDSNGSVTAGAIGGEIDIIDVNLASTTTPIGLQHGNGVLTLTRDRVNIRSFLGTLGGGTVTAQGGVAFRPAVNFDLGMAAKGVRVLYPQGLRETANANLRFVGTTQRAFLGGTVDLTDMSLTPGFDLTSFIGQFSGGVAPPPSRGFTQDVTLNVAARTPNNISLVSPGMSVGGSANVQVRGTLADPVLLGRVSLSGGDMILHGDRFVLNGGTVQFVNPTATEPVVNLNMSTKIQQYNINMRFSGPVDQMQTAYTSDPALPTADIINLLAFGQTTEASAANPTPANQAAESLVASQVSEQVTSRISKIAGISQLSVNPVLAGSSTQGPPGANITIQQRVTGNLFVTFSSNVASTQAQTIQGQYQVSPRVAISATRDPNGGFAVDTLIKKSW